jgi:methionine sulfoxide reductase catalytic subunit
VSEEWKSLARTGFKEYRLTIGGMVEHPVTLSLDELRTLERREHISLNPCRK